MSRDKLTEEEILKRNNTRRKNGWFKNLEKTRKKQSISAKKRERAHHTEETKLKISQSLMKNNNIKPKYCKYCGNCFVKDSMISVSSWDTREFCSGSCGAKYRDNPSSETRRKMRESAIQKIERQSFDGLPMMPGIGKYETQILDVLEKCFSYPILRQYKIAGFFLDGYCPSLNLAIEIDEKHHQKPEQLKKDEYRENMIKNELKCQFLRIEV